MACVVMAGLAATDPIFGDFRLVDLTVAAVGIEQAARMVRGSEGGRILGAETRNINGRTVHIFKVLTPDGKRVRYVQVDAESGQIMGGR
jgi:uncharacterized membrane protein YkoI